MKKLFLTPAITLLLLLAACGPSAREAELQTQVDQAEVKASKAEAKAAQFQSQLATAETKLSAMEINLEDARSKIAAFEADLASAVQARAETPKPKEDLQYVILKRQYAPGKFVTVQKPDGKDETQKVEPLYELTFKGVQTGKIYPVMQVKDSVYSQFKEGVTYSRADLNRATK